MLQSLFQLTTDTDCAQLAFFVCAIIAMILLFFTKEKKE